MGEVLIVFLIFWIYGVQTQDYDEEIDWTTINMLSRKWRFHKKNTVQPTALGQFSTKRSEDVTETDPDTIVFEFSRTFTTSVASSRSGSTAPSRRLFEVKTRQPFFCKDDDTRYFCVQDQISRDPDYCSHNQKLPYCELLSKCAKSPTSDQCIDCSNNKYRTGEACLSILALCETEYLQYNYPTYDITNIHQTCLTWKPNCKSAGMRQYHVCFDCFVTPETIEDKEIFDKICANLDCTVRGRDKGTDGCQRFTANCKLPKHKDEDACIDCGPKGKHKDDARCILRNCTREATDRFLDVCKTWQPDCSDEAHRFEDLCLDCVGEDSSHKACTAQAWDCDKVHAKLAICYYSTTSTTPRSFEEDDIEVFHFDLGLSNETNIYLGKKTYREDYFTDVTVPTFLCITIIVGALFVLLHLPKCCFGLFREPDWATYGSPKEEEDEVDTLHDQIVKK